MGEASAITWADELRRTGRVVFTQRPRAVLSGLLRMWVPYAFAQWLSSSGRLGDDGPWIVVLVVVLCVTITCWYGLELVIRRPVLTVSQQGVQVRRRFLTWAEVGAIGIPRGFKAYWSLPIIPRDTRGKDLVVNYTTVKNIPALARWLEDVSREHRENERARGRTSDGGG
ncbi:hypothetical protein AB0F43_14630 [Kribbella sp. NPDC023972]|uniref:hypothetical protein n=1 Tax=Kribbella sp. NPDC023972 TaxID=3154795 RepID=UPI0033BFD996